jgi:hypothetical protein
VLVTYLTNNIKSKTFTIKANNLGEETWCCCQINKWWKQTVPNCSAFLSENAITSVPAYGL